MAKKQKEKLAPLDAFMADAAASGYSDARIRDIAFAILNNILENPKICYQVIFPNDAAGDAAVDSYTSLPLLRFFNARVEALMRERHAVKPVESKSAQSKKSEELSFEQNKAEIVRQIKELEALKSSDDDISKKDILAIEQQILRARLALNDKFKVSEDADQQYIVVRPKYNHVCEWTGRECHLLTKEEAMEQFDLIPNPKTIN